MRASHSCVESSQVNGFGSGKVGCIVGAADVGAADVGADVEVGSRYVSIPGCVTLSLYPVKGLMLGRLPNQPKSP